MSLLVCVGQSVAVVNICYDKDVLKDFAHLVRIRMRTAIGFSGATLQLLGTVLYFVSDTSVHESF